MMIVWAIQAEIPAPLSLAGVVHAPSTLLAPILAVALLHATRTARLGEREILGALKLATETLLQKR